YSRGVSVMDMKEGDIVASVAILREGSLSRVNETRPENGQSQEAAEAVTAVAPDTTVQGEMN
ncbi:MAG: hypothetical protein WAM60_17180, partial [Candidatus Promineifilaceae bacterium]